MRCPRDKMPLENFEFEGVMVDGCSYCDGIWLDNKELKSITGMEADVLDGDIIEQDIEWDEILMCPLCNVEMEKRFFSKQSEIAVDRCPECFGIWLDTGEMRVVLETTRKIKDDE